MTSPTPYAQANGTTVQSKARIDDELQSGKQKPSSDANTSTRNRIQQPASPSSLASISAHIHAKITSFLSEQHDPSSLLHRVQDQTRISLSVIQDALSRYSLAELSLSYNGGKDCLVLLLLFLASLHTHDLHSPNPSSASSNNTDDTNHTSSTNNHNTNPSDTDTDTIPAIYVRPAHPFPSVESFVATSSRHYHLQLARYTTNPPHTTLRTAFSDYLSAHPHIRAVFVGTRRTDPHGATLSHFDATDHGWPDFMRIHPVIDWHYVEIWAFIRHLGVEYCPLYDEGYTSLGGTNDTHPNPKLRKITVEATEKTKNEENHAFRPAYELMDDDEERLGRDWS